jgi:hypothetical protein
MITLQEIMAELLDADADRIAAAVLTYGPLPVRLAMLGIASTKKGESPVYYGYPPGVFLSYKWEGEAMQSYVKALASYLRGRGYLPFLDIENLDSNADDYFAVPQFITSLQQCVYYLLLLTEQTADYVTARKHKTSWIFDEYQHAVRLVNSGRMILIPLLLEEGGITEFFGRDRVVDLSRDRYSFDRLDSLFPPGNPSLTEAEQRVLRQCLDDFDRVFLQEKFPEALAVLLNNLQFSNTFDHGFRMMLYAIYTANQDLVSGTLNKLYQSVPEKVVVHLYSGYCEKHGIPNRLAT